MTLVVPPEYNNNGQPAPAQPVVILDGTGAIVSAFGGGSGGSAGAATTMGQATMAASAPVVIASDQSTVPTQDKNSGTPGSISGTAQTPPNSGTGFLGWLSGIYTRLSGTLVVQGVAGGIALASTDSNGGISGSVSGVVQTPPNGGVGFLGWLSGTYLSTAAILSKLASGQAKMTGSTAVVIASDQSTLPTQDTNGGAPITSAPVLGTGGSGFLGWLSTLSVSTSAILTKLIAGISTADVTLPDVVSGAQSLNSSTVGNVVTIPTASGKATNRITITGLTGSGATLAPMASGVSATAGFLGTTVNTTPAGTTVTSITTDGVYVFRCAATAAVQLAVAVAGSGTITVNSVQSSAPDAVVVTGSALPIGAATAAAQGTGNTSLASLVAALSGAGVIATRTPVKLTMTYVTVPASTTAATRVSALNGTRKSIQILNIGTGFASTVSNATSTTTTTVPTLTGTTPFVPGAGYPLEPAASAGRQGGSTPIYDGVNTSTDAWDAISTTGTTLLVIEGN